MVMRQAPPSRRSSLHDSMVKPRGTHQCRMRSGSTKARNTSSRGASRTLVSVNSRVSARLASLAFAAMALSLALAGRLDLLQIVFQAVEPLLPELPVGRHPLGDLAQRRRLQPARPALRLAAACDQASVLQHLQMLGDR